MDMHFTENIDYKIKDLKLYSDSRGALFEALRFKSEKIPNGGQIYVYSVMPGFRRGDHYHERKGEWFCCVAGTVTLLMKANGKKIKKILKSKRPQLVYVGPGTAHTIINKNKEEAIMVAYASKEFDPNDPDTISKKIN